MTFRKRAGRVPWYGAVFTITFQYLDRHGSVASRLCEAGVPAWVVHGERGDGGVTADQLTAVTVDGTGSHASGATGSGWTVHRLV